MKKTIIIISCALVVLGLVAWGTYNWLASSVKSADNTSEANEEAIKEVRENRKNIEGTITEKDLATFQEKDLNPFGEGKKIKELSDIMYQEYIHGMSHQKVEASKKWGFYEIHPGRITWLLEGLDKVELNKENIYRDILGKWKNDNFSSVDDDHNTIWSLQNGTVGRATGILSAEEEQVYVNSNSD